MKNLTLFLLGLSCLLMACNEASSEAFESDQAMVEEKLEAIRDLVKKYELPDSVFQNITRMSEEKILEFKTLDLQVLEGQLSSWASFKKSMAPYQDAMKEMNEVHQKAWAEIDAESDPEKKAALEEKYWNEVFPELEKQSKAMEAASNNQH